MRFEFSAGGVVYRTDRGRVEILVAQHSYHHGWVFPKGLIGDKDHLKGESKEDTAVREVKEETGIDGKILETIKPVTYWYVFEGEKRKKTVYYYVMEYLGGNETERDTEMEAVDWVDLDKAEEKLTYKSDKEVFKQALPIIERLAQ